MNRTLRTPGRPHASLLPMMLLAQLPLWLAGCPVGLDPEDAGAPSGDGNVDPSAGLRCVSCHESPMGGRRAVADTSGSRGHALHGGPWANESCEACHEMTQHQQGRVRLWDTPLSPESLIVLEGDPRTASSEADKLTPFCQTCHGASAFTPHAVAGDWRPACTTCHDLHDPSGQNRAWISPVLHNQTLDKDKPVTFTARTGPGSFQDGTGDPDGLCQVCHVNTAYHRHDGSGSAHHEGEDCTKCHAHANGFIPAGGSSCTDCHSSPQGSRQAVVRADGTASHHPAGAVLTDADCTTCHEMSQHRSGTVRLWNDVTNPTTAISVTDGAEPMATFCGGCHDQPGAPIIHHTGTAWNPTCSECHDLHDPENENLALIAQVVRNRTLGVDKAVVFTARSGPGSFSDGVGANDGICQVCHTATTHHLNDGGGSAHHEGEDCTVCHAHSAGFVPVGGTSCIGCHNQVQAGRRPVVGEFDLASHHVTGAAVTDADCTACHEMSQHQQGHVRLKNADDPDNPAAVVSLAGDPSASPTEAAKLEPFCLACHDADGAGGAAPFSDGITPPPIDATLWAVASHSSGQMTCFGDGQGFGCHGSGHGSAKANLLAPPDGSQPPVPGDALREEEGLCYSCHDADGPAATDVESQFNRASRHGVSALDQIDGSKIECVHCHEPHTLSAASPLSDPDSGAAWTGSGEGFCLVCHDGTPPAGVTFPPSSSGSGHDKSAFIGTTHDTETGSNSCGHCHRAHGSAHIAILRELYVVADYNEYSAGDGDYDACWLCHDEDKVIQQDNAFDNRHKKHVVDEDAPCIVCHDAHGGFDAGEPGLIDVARPAEAGYDLTLTDGRDGSSSFWIDAGPNRGNCALRCHGEDHDPESYDRTGDALTADCSACHWNQPGP